MEDIRRYILSFVSAAIICSLIKILVRTKSKNDGLITIVCGLFMAITALSPVVDIKIPDYSSSIRTVYATAEQITQEAAATAEENMAGIIKEKVQAYILEKASSLNMDVDVEVNLNDKDLVPASIVVTGSVSPYEKALLRNYIHKTLNIPEERQVWKE